MSVEILIGDAIDRLRELPADSVHCCVTSPPYWGLRDYGTGEWEGGEPACDHMQAAVPRLADDPGIRCSTLEGGKRTTTAQAEARSFRDRCGKCGARRVDQQIGLEETPEAWVARLVEVFREVRRVLRKDGVCFVNIGDSYAGSWGAQGRNGQMSDRSIISARQITAAQQKGSRTGSIPPGSDCKPKDLIGQPWLLAFALRADGWWLRSEIIWAKPNPMPESVRDRPTKAHEQVFLLTKSERYFYDVDAIRETADQARLAMPGNGAMRSSELETFGLTAATGRTNPSCTHPAGRNARSVWTIATEPYSEAHFATFPTELARRCILAGTSAKGCCPECAAPWARVVETDYTPSPKGTVGRKEASGQNNFDGALMPRMDKHVTTTGWRQTCACDAGEPAPCTVLDCFGGSGTTGLVADQLGRNAILCELNPAYADMARRRIDGARARRMIGDAERVPVLPGQAELGL